MASAYPVPQAPVNLLLAALACAGCADPGADGRWEPGWPAWYPVNPVFSASADARGAVRLAAPETLTPLLGPLAGQVDAPDGAAEGAPVLRLPALPPELGGTIEGARVNDDLGQDLVAWMESQTRGDEDSYGVALLTVEEAAGDPITGEGICEPVEIQWDFTDDGADWEAAARLWGYTYLLDPVRPVAWTFGEGDDCDEALLAAGGDVDAALASGDCTVGHELAFFREGSTCRACLEERAGDYDACVEAGECAAEGQLVTPIEYLATGEEVWFDAWYAYTPACAPTYTIETILLSVERESEDLPEPFDHTAWAHFCAPFWDLATDGLTWNCSGATLPVEYDGQVLAEGVVGPTSYIRAAGTADTTWADRRYFAHSVSFRNGSLLALGWAGNPGSGLVSAPPHHTDTNGDGVVGLGDENWGQAMGGFGLNPVDLRPDGVDPSALDDTYARDWLAAVVLKTSTTRNGVPVMFSNHNRCTEGAWSQSADGTWTCARMDPPTEGWLGDGMSVWVDAAHTLPYVDPMVTVGSTGLPDPDVPGGVVVEVAAAPVLSDPDFEGCEGYPTTFQPARVPFPDVPDVYDPAAESLVGESYRFGADDLDLRVVLSTNWARGHCPTDGAP
jgi:hypothetical protein